MNLSINKRVYPNRYWASPEAELKEQIIKRDEVIAAYQERFAYLLNQPWYISQMAAQPVERIVEKEVTVERPYEPKNFGELLHNHDHQWSKGFKGQTQCRICGLYKAAYQLLTPLNTK